MAQDTQTYNLLVRFPENMREAMREAARADERSVNWLIVAAVRRYLENVQVDRRSRFAEIVYSVSQPASVSREAPAADVALG